MMNMSQPAVSKNNNFINSESGIADSSNDKTLGNVTDPNMQSNIIAQGSYINETNQSKFTSKDIK